MMQVQGSTSLYSHTEGFRFHPIDRELMKYLLHYVIGKDLPTLVPIEHEDLYSKEPWLFFEGKKERMLYFFTELKKKKTENMRFVRSVGKGSWKSQDKGKPVCSERGSILGYKRSLRFQHSGSPHDGQWLMKEYSLSEEIKRKLRQREYEYNKENYVLCRVKRKSRGDDPIIQKETIETEELNYIIDGPPIGSTNSLTLTLFKEDYNRNQ